MKIDKKEQTKVTTTKKTTKKAEPKTGVSQIEEVTNETIQAWKKQYGKVFKNVISGTEIYWRPLKRGEYKEIIALSEGAEEADMLLKQEKTVSKAALFPINIDEVIENEAGLATILCDEILEHSGFSMTKTEEL